MLAGEVAYTIESDTLELRTTTDAGEIGLNLVASDRRLMTAAS